MWGRPPALVLLVAGFAYFSAASLTRFVATLKSWQLLHTLYPVGAPEFLLTSGFTFFVLSLVIAIGLWIGYQKAWKGALFMIPGYWAVAWLERAVVAFRFGLPADWLFFLIYNLLTILIGVLLLYRESTQRFIFGEENKS